ncbi:hypothetical protein PFISCL1PPCAC_15701, partial [Pristionchus fissidentatus]
TQQEDGSDSRVVEDESGNKFYDLSSLDKDPDLSHFLLSHEVYVNESPPPYPPITLGTGRFVYVTAVKSRSDVKKCKVDYSGSWNCNGNREKGEIGCRESSRFDAVIEVNGLYKKDPNGSVLLQTHVAFKPSLRRLRRRIWIDMSPRKEPLGRVVTEYLYKEPGEAITLTNSMRVGDVEKMEIKQKLLTKSTKEISAEHADVTTQQVRNISRDVQERRKLNVGRKKK